MIPANDILARRNEIKDCLAAANLEKAVKRLIDFARDFDKKSEDEVIILSMEYYELDEEVRKAIIAYSDAKLTKRQIAFRMLQTLGAMMNKLGHND